LACLAIVGAR